MQDQQTRSQKRPPENARTRINRHLVQPLRLIPPILALPPPSQETRLPLVVPYFLSRCWDWIPLTRAKRSYLIGNLGLGRDLVR